MEIIYIHQHFSTDNGATGSRSYEIAKRLVKKGHKVTIVCGSYTVANTGLSNAFYKGKREGVVDGINIIEHYIPYSNGNSFYSRIYSFIKFVFRSCQDILTTDYDIAYVTSTPLTVAIPALMGKYIRGKPYIFEVRDLWPQLPEVLGFIRNRVLLKCLYVLEKMAYRNASVCIGLSPGIVEGIKKTSGCPSVIMIPNACDLALFNCSSQNRNAIKELEGSFVALYSGTHGFANGLNVLVDTAEILKSKGANVKILLVGDGQERSDLILSVKSRKLDNILLWPPVGKKELAVIMSSCNVGLQILRNIPEFYYGTSPNKFFDYISAGLPVLCNYPGWISDIIKANSCGMSVSPDSPNEIADALIKLSQSEAKLRQMSVQSLCVAKEQFDRDITISPLFDYLDKYEVKKC